MKGKAGAIHYNRFSNVAAIAVPWALPLYTPPPGSNSIACYGDRPMFYNQPFPAYFMVQLALFH